MKKVLVESGKMCACENCIFNGLSICQLRGGTFKISCEETRSLKRLENIFKKNTNKKKGKWKEIFGFVKN
jgi:hypothetical protein